MGLLWHAPPKDRFIVVGDPLNPLSLGLGTVFAWPWSKKLIVFANAIEVEWDRLEVSLADGAVKFPLHVSLGFHIKPASSPRVAALWALPQFEVEIEARRELASAIHARLRPMYTDALARIPWSGFHGLISDIAESCGNELGMECLSVHIRETDFSGPGAARHKARARHAAQAAIFGAVAEVDAADGKLPGVKFGDDRVTMVWDGKTPAGAALWIGATFRFDGKRPKDGMYEPYGCVIGGVEHAAAQIFCGAMDDVNQSGLLEPLTDATGAAKLIGPAAGALLKLNGIGMQDFEVFGFTRRQPSPSAPGT